MGYDQDHHAWTCDNADCGVDSRFYTIHSCTCGQHFCTKCMTQHHKEEGPSHVASEHFRT